MEGVKKKWKELVYSFSTNDHYAEYNPNKSSGAGGIALRGGASSVPASSSQIQLTESIEGGDLGGNEGVSETLLAWRHVDSWASEHNPDLFATLSDPCTRNDINNAEKDLNIMFPASVRASLRSHDGQEDLGTLAGTSGLLYGLTLMPLDQIVQMTQTWRNVAENMSRHRAAAARAAAADQERGIEGSSGSSAAAAAGTASNDAVKIEVPNKSVTPQVLRSKGYGKLETQDYSSMNPNLQRDISVNHNAQFKMKQIPTQGSVPRDAIQPVYAHPGWIPLVTDNAGNHVAIDLAPGPRGSYAQVILFGRDFDTKYVVAKNWGDFLLSFANDLEKGNWYLVDEDDDFFGGEGELVFRDKNAGNRIMDYLEVLKQRAWAKAKRTDLGHNEQVQNKSSQPMRSLIDGSNLDLGQVSSQTSSAVADPDFKDNKDTLVKEETAEIENEAQTENTVTESALPAASEPEPKKVASSGAEKAPKLEGEEPKEAILPSKAFEDLQETEAPATAEVNAEVLDFNDDKESGDKLGNKETPKDVAKLEEEFESVAL
ncbi:LAMI_0G02344g1_1 [Lachancea mirantina]|uniref:LAMI_0G02344g1_1 n=1 Tax=Lachancea mirantina TaxID=1230905 RepID=A0A1G4K7W8_9SACH|nr:LAMI_0G02344g1_1 [Lachancea mirantina]